MDYFEFEKMICETMGIELPEFVIETEEGTVFQAVIPARSDIPDNLQMTVAQALQALKRAR